MKKLVLGLLFAGAAVLSGNTFAQEVAVGGAQISFDKETVFAHLLSQTQVLLH